MAASQRWRLLGAAAETFDRHGYLGTTSRLIAVGAGVSASTFYRYFDDVPDCLCAAFEVAAASLLYSIETDHQVLADEGTGVAPSIAALLGFVAAEPQLSRLLTTEAAVAVAEIAVRRRRLIDQLAGLVGKDLGEGESAPAASAVVRTAVAASLSISCDRGDDDQPRAVDLNAQLIDLFVSLKPG